MGLHANTRGHRMRLEITHLPPPVRSGRSRWTDQVNQLQSTTKLITQRRTSGPTNTCERPAAKEDSYVQWALISTRPTPPINSKTAVTAAAGKSRKKPKRRKLRRNKKRPSLSRSTPQLLPRLPAIRSTSAADRLWQTCRCWRRAHFPIERRHQGTRARLRRHVPSACPVQRLPD